MARFAPIAKQWPIAKRWLHSGPLKDIRVVDLTRVLAILSDYGADVVKIEQSTGDDTRFWRTPGEQALWTDAHMSAYFANINRNKRSVTLNLKHERGRSVLFDLIKTADVVVENFIPGKLEELGISYEKMQAVQPGIIYGSISGYGQTGPYAHRAGYDAIAAAEGGLLHITGERNGRPVRPGLGLTDMCTGLFMHGAILAALRARDATGRGQRVDTSLFETQVALLGNVAMSWLNAGQEAQRWGCGHPSIVPYDCFTTRDSYFVVGAVNDRQFGTLCRLIGQQGLVSEQRYATNEKRVENREELGRIVDAAFAKRSTSEWMGIFEGSGMPYGPLNSIQQVFEHPQVQARQMVHAVADEGAVAGEVKILGPPVKFSETQPSIRRRAPRLGEHTEEVLHELGHDVEELRRKNAI